MKKLLKTLPRPRLLPIVIAASGLLLSIKMGALWQERGVAFAETTPPPAATTPAATTPAATGPSATPPGAPATNAETPAPDTHAADAPAAKQTAAGSSPSSGPEGSPPKAKTAGQLDAADKPAFSSEEAASLQQLSQRKADLEKRAADLDHRELLLKAVEQQLNDKIQALHQQQAALEASIGKVDDQGDERLKSLVKIYETMKPADAARIFDQMEMPVLLQLLTRMKESKTAPILAAMNPEKARIVTINMASKPAIPGSEPKPAKQLN